MRIVLIVIAFLLVLGTGLPLLASHITSATPSGWTSISSYDSNACGIYSGQAYCWGFNQQGQAGSGAIYDTSTPTVVSTSGVLHGKTMVSISVGDQSVCALDSAGKAYCWGVNTNGQLGDGTNTRSNVPVAVDTSGVLSGKVLKAVSVSGGTIGTSACGLDTAGKVYCWGQNTNGELGDGTNTDSNVPVAVDMTGVLSGKTVTMLSTGDATVCIVASDSKGYCWGQNIVGQLGNNSTDDSSVPVAVDTSDVLAGKTLASISAGAQVSCALDTTGKSYCWGDDSTGQLGDGMTGFSQYSVPIAVDTSGALAGKTLVSVSAGLGGVCALDSGGLAYCWGFNGSGTIGDGTTDNSSLPIAVDTSGALAGKTLTMIELGVGSTCAIDSTHQAYCWGTNSLGQLGAGDRNDAAIPYTPLALLAPSIRSVAGVTFANQSGRSVMTITGTSFPIYFDAFLESLVSLNSTALPVCSTNTGMSAADIVTNFGSSPSIVSDGPPCYFIDDDSHAQNFHYDQAVVWLPGGFDTAAAGTVSIAGSPAFSFNTSTPGGSGGSTPTVPASPSDSTSTSTTTSGATSDTSETTATIPPTVSTDDQALADNRVISSLPTFSGMADPGSTVVVTVHSDSVTCTTTADSAGHWTCTLSTALPAGTHTVNVVITTPDGRVFNLGPYTVTVEADSTPTTVSGVVAAKSVPANLWMYVAIGVGALVVLIIIVVIARKNANKVL